MNRQDVTESLVDDRDEFEMDLQVAARSRVPVLISGSPRCALMLAQAIAGLPSRVDSHMKIVSCDLADCDLVVEAITESLAAKLEMWRTLDTIVKPEGVFATNTSSLAVIDQAAATSRPERFIGLHFFNPAQVMKLLEVVRCVTTGDEAFETGLAFGERIGKLTVQTKDKAGFIVNRLLVPYMLDAIRAYEEGVGSIQEIDDAMKAGAGHPMGPLTLADFVGLDTLGAICDVMFDEFREKRFAQPPILRKMLAAGWYGRKSGMGFYDYSGESPVENPGL